MLSTGRALHNRGGEGEVTLEERAEQLYADIASEVGRGGSAVQIPLIIAALGKVRAEAYSEVARMIEGIDEPVSPAKLARDIRAVFKDDL